MSTRGSADVLTDVVVALRNDGDLVALLPDAEAIYHGYPTADRGYSVEVNVAVVYQGSTPHRGAAQRSYRVQVSVVSTYAWRERRDDEGIGGLPRMMEILDQVADTLDTFDGLAEVPQGGEGGPVPQEVAGGDDRLGLIADWRADGYETTDGRIGE